MTGFEAIFGLLGAVVSAAGSIAQGKAEAAAAEYNAEMLEAQAKQRREAAAAEAQDYKRQEHRKLSSSQAARGATGVVATAGSPLLVDEATVRESALGASRLGYRGMVEGIRLENEAKLEEQKADAARQASYFAAGTSLLSGFGSLYGAI